MLFNTSFPRSITTLDFIPLSSMQTVAPEGSSATKRFKEILLGSSKKTSFLKEPSCSIEILLGSSSLLRSTQLQNEDANQEQHAIQDEENEDNQESLFPGLKVVMFDEASTLMVLVRLTLIHLVRSDKKYF